MRQLLGFEKDIEVVAVYGSGIECLEQIDEYLPDVIFMDIRMPGISGIETTRLLCQKYPNIKVIMLTAHDEVQYVTDAISAGAKGYVLKKVRQEELIKIIHDVIDNKSFLDPDLIDSLFNKLKHKKSPLKGEENQNLTKRELEVLQYMVDGSTDEGIAKLLFISKFTVRSHIRNIFQKFNATSKTQVVSKAIGRGIVREREVKQ
ncbi:MAG: response regulator transcription factor [Desulfobacula sp.]|uniref:response regulator n=1 Tax=Desulfobacula sp. TaxID=2593537 RepID=UPI002A070BE7|nr:response regulator transcription factor [Desulfobacula sp.]